MAPQKQQGSSFSSHMTCSSNGAAPAQSRELLERLQEQHRSISEILESSVGSFGTRDSDAAEMSLYNVLCEATAIADKVHQDLLSIDFDFQDDEDSEDNDMRSSSQ